MAWRAMPHCNNMSLRRTKSKVARPRGGICETLVHKCHVLDAEGRLGRQIAGILDS